MSLIWSATGEGLEGGRAFSTESSSINRRYSHRHPGGLRSGLRLVSAAPMGLKWGGK